MTARRLLVVDDDRQMVRTLTDIFRMRGWEVSGAYSGEEAVRATAERTFDVVLMDILMPGMNGVEALREIRGRSPHVRVLLMTAHSGNELVEQAEQSGAMRILSKPVVIPELLKLLEAQQPDGHFVVVLEEEDDPCMRDLEACLGERGHSVLRTRSLDRAIQTLVNRSPEVVVLNLPLEDVRPEESVLAIRRADPSVVLILCSEVPSLLENASRSVPSDWIYARLMKPFPPEHLLELLDEL